MSKQIGQIIFNYDGIPNTITIAEETFYVAKDLKAAMGFSQIYKLGIQAPPGTKLVLNGQVNILIGQSGIYEFAEPDIIISDIEFVRTFKYVLDEEQTAIDRETGLTEIKTLTSDISDLVAKGLGEEKPNVADALGTEINDLNNAYNTYLSGEYGVYSKKTEHVPLKNIIIDYVYEAGQEGQS